MTMAISTKSKVLNIDELNDIETGGYGSEEETEPIKVSALQKRDELVAKFTSSELNPNDFSGRSRKIQSKTLETGRMLRDNPGMPPELFEGGREAVNALRNFDAAVQYVDDIKNRGEKVLTRAHLENINKLVVGQDLNSTESVIRDYNAYSRDEKRGGLVWKFPSPEKINEGLEEIIEWQNLAIEDNLDPKATAEITADLLVRLHPFKEGNGRTAMVVEKFFEAGEPAKV